MLLLVFAFAFVDKKQNLTVEEVGQSYQERNNNLMQQQKSIFI